MTKATTYLDGPDGLRVLVGASRVKIRRLTEDMGYEEIDRETFLERADGRESADSETHDGHA